MPASRTWRFNEGTIIPAGATIGGSIDADNGVPTYLTTQNSWVVYTSSSSDTVESRCYWWFDTSVIPDATTITSVQFKVRYSSASYDEFFSSVGYYLFNNALGSTLDDTDYLTATVASGVLIGQDVAPAAGFFFDSGVITSAPALAAISKTGYTQVMAKMTAFGSTASYIDYTQPSAWRTVSDIVPRLIVTGTLNNQVLNVGVPTVVGVPAKVGTPSKVGVPVWVYNP